MRDRIFHSLSFIVANMLTISYQLLVVEIDGTDKTFFLGRPHQIYPSTLTQHGRTQASHLIKAFNASDSYQSIGRPLEPHQNPYSWALRRYKKGTKATIKALTARNHEAVYIHTDHRQGRYTDSPKNILTLIFWYLELSYYSQKLPYIDFGIGAVVAGTTPVTTISWCIMIVYISVDFISHIEETFYYN